MIKNSSSRISYVMLFQDPAAGLHLGAQPTRESVQKTATVLDLLIVQTHHKALSKFHHFSYCPSECQASPPKWLKS